jgi:recombination endonuclease VII
MKGVYKDLTDKVFGRLTVKGRAEKINGRIAWKCVCTCGNKVDVITQSLTMHKTKSCGCLHAELTSNNLIGKKFGKWKVTGPSEKRSSNGYKYWTCGCECGIIKEISGEGLLLGLSTQCRKCAHEGLKKQFCINGHDTEIWGRTSSYACRACIKNKHLITHYGITLEEFIRLYEYQNGKCCVCKKDLGSYLPKNPGFGKSSRIEVDHDHKIKNKRKSVRGLLCGGRFAGCNRKLGHIDNSEWLESAAQYIANPPAQSFLKGE